MLFSWHFEGFKLLRRYFVKHPTGVDLENLDLEGWIKKWQLTKPLSPWLLRVMLLRVLLLVVTLLPMLEPVIFPL